MADDFLLVEWSDFDPSQYLVCKKADLVDGLLRHAKRQDLIGKSVTIQWKLRHYLVRVLNVGPKKALEKKAIRLAAEIHLREAASLKFQRTGTAASKLPYPVASSARGGRRHAAHRPVLDPLPRTNYRLPPADSRVTLDDDFEEVDDDPDGGASDGDSTKFVLDYPDLRQTQSGTSGTKRKRTSARRELGGPNYMLDSSSGDDSSHPDDVPLELDSKDFIRNVLKEEVSRGGPKSTKNGVKRKRTNVELSRSRDLQGPSVGQAPSLADRSGESDPYLDDPDGVIVDQKGTEGIYKRKYEALLVKYRELERKYSQVMDKSARQHLVELVPGSSVWLKKFDLDRIKMISKHPTVLARNLFRHFFTSEELSTHSLFGLKCNANKDTPVLPAIDDRKRDSIIQFILNDAGYDDVDCRQNKDLQSRRRSLKREVTKTLSDFLREEHRKCTTTKSL